MKNEMHLSETKFRLEDMHKKEHLFQLEGMHKKVHLFQTIDVYFYLIFLAMSTKN